MTFEQVFETKDSLFIVLEYISGGELARRLEEVQKMSDVEAKAIFYQLVLAIQYLHKKGIAHRDLKVNIYYCFVVSCSYSKIGFYNLFYSIHSFTV